MRRLCSFSNPSVASPTSQLFLLIRQPFRRFIYVTAHYPTLPSLHLHHNLFSNPSVTSPTSHALHLCHLASCPLARPPLEPNSRYATGSIIFLDRKVAPYGINKINYHTVNNNQNQATPYQSTFQFALQYDIDLSKVEFYNFQAVAYIVSLISITFP